MGDAGKAADPHGFSLKRSGLLTALLLLGVLLVFALLWRAHQKAAFHQLTATDAPVVAATPMPGGQEAATLTRPILLHNTVPEFVSTTVLPGLGMQVLQMLVNIPHHGMVALFDGPSVAEIAASTKVRPDVAPLHLMLTPVGMALGSSVDLIAGNSATSVVNLTQADGGEVTGTFSLADAAGRLTGVEAKVDSSMTGRSFDMDVRLRNNALTSHEFSLNWSPHLHAPGDDLSRFVLSLPSNNRLEDGAIRPVTGTPLDFSTPHGKTVPNVDFDNTYVALERRDIGDGPAVLLTDARSGLVLRFVLLTPSIRSIRVRANSITHTLMLSFSTDDGAQRTRLQAGESADWRVRLDVLPLPTDRASATPVQF